MFTSKAFANGVLFLLMFLGFSISVFSQDGAKPVFPTAKEDQVQITLHRAILNVTGRVQFKSDNEVITGNALSAEEVTAGFKANEKIVIRVTVPYDFYIYIVNASDWEGIKLVYPYNNAKAPNKQFPANKPTDFAYEFVPDGTVTGREEYLILISKIKIDSPKLDEIMKGDGKISLTNQQKETAKKELNEPTTVEVLKTPPTATTKEVTKTTPVTNTDTTKKATMPTTTDKKGKFSWLSTPCKVAGIFFPFVNSLCSLLPKGANPIFNDENQILIIPTEKAEKIAFRLSFAVSK
jgi:hypothetical protein